MEPVDYFRVWVIGVLRGKVWLDVLPHNTWRLFGSNIENTFIFGYAYSVELGVKFIRGIQTVPSGVVPF